MIEAPALPRTSFHILVNGSSAASGIPPSRPTPVSDCGSPRPSLPPMAAGCTSRVRASTRAPPSRFICRLLKMLRNPRHMPMTDPSPVVLVVDDEVQIRRFLRAGLELDGFTVQDAETGA